ncbi:hypothetical protein JOM56_003548 [Amanita muscaria]
MAVEAFLATRSQRAFIATKAIVVVVLVAVVFGKVAGSVGFANLYKTIPCYLALFALAAIFEVLMTLDALYMRNIIQLFGLLVFHLGLMIAAAVQVRETDLAFTLDPDCQAQADLCEFGVLNTIKPLLIISPCIIAVSWVSLCYFFKELYAEFGWAIFHVVGANPKMKQMYRHYQILICLLKFDFFAFTGVTMQLLIVVLQSNSREFGLTITAIPVVLILLILCGIAVQREVKWIMYISLALMLASLSYFFKLVRFYDPQFSAEYRSTRVTLTVFSIISFLLISTSFYYGLRCLLDFEKGLLDSKMHAIPRRRPGHSQKYSSDKNNDTSQEYQTGAPLTHRISIE